MAQNPKHPLKNMTLPLLQENGQSFRHPPPRPPPPATATPSKTPLNCVPIQSTNSTSSSSSAFDQFSKRVTRDLPNLSDCHGCGVRINHTDPDDRLLTLDSFWRIVLLCKKCIRCVDSGQTCPYCFKNTDDTDCSKCRSCKRQVHKDCVSRYGNSAPWSFCSREEGGLFVCIDCWVPNFFKKSIGDCRKIQKDVLNIQHCSSDFKSSEKIAKHANLEGLRKEVVVGLKAKNSTLQKAVVAKNPTGLAKSALESVVKKGKSKGKVVSKDVNDAQLAFQLHRSMNSSPRISKTLGPKNSSYVGGPEIQTLRSSTGERLKVYSRTKYRGKVGPTSPETPPSVMVYSRTRLKEKVDQTTSETSPRVSVYSRRRLKEEVGKASSDASPCLLVYSRTRFKEKVCQTDSEAPPCVTTNECGSCVDSACSKAELLTYKRNKLKRKTCDEKVVFTEDRYLLKYSRRKRCWKPGSDVHEDTFPQPTPDRSMPSNCCHSI